MSSCGGVTIEQLRKEDAGAIPVGTPKSQWGVEEMIMIFPWLSKLFLLLLISTGLLLGCQLTKQSSVNEPTENTNITDDPEPALSSQPVAIKSEEDARRVMQEDPLFEAELI